MLGKVVIYNVVLPFAFLHFIGRSAVDCLRVLHLRQCHSSQSVELLNAMLGSDYAPAIAYDVYDSNKQIVHATHGNKEKIAALPLTRDMNSAVHRFVALRIALMSCASLAYLAIVVNSRRIMKSKRMCFHKWCAHYGVMSIDCERYVWPRTVKPILMECGGLNSDLADAVLELSDHVYCVQSHTIGIS